MFTGIIVTRVAGRAIGHEVGVIILDHLIDHPIAIFMAIDTGHTRIMVARVVAARRMGEIDRRPALRRMTDVALLSCYEMFR